MDKGMEWLIAVVSGILSGIVVAITIWLIRVIFLSPKIQIADKICEDKTACKFKVVNKTKCMITELSYVLTCRKKVIVGREEKVKVKRLYPKFGDTYTYIPGFKKKEGYSRYSIVISFDKAEIVNRINKGYEIEFVVNAVHSISKVGKCFIGTYGYGDLMKGHFIEGESMEVVKDKNA